MMAQTLVRTAPERSGGRETRLRHLFAFLALLILSTTTAAACNDFTQPVGAAALREELQTLLNGERVRHGLEPLALNVLLQAASRNYACLLAESQHFDHVGPDGRTPADRAARAGYQHCTLAENLAVGQESVREVFAGWMSSDGHRRNMLLGEVREFGFAAVRVEEAPDIPGVDPGGGLAALFRPEGGPIAPKAEPAGLESAGRFYWVLMLGVRC